MKPYLFLLCLAVALCTAACSGTSTSEKSTARNPSSAKPKLVVGIVIDQFRFDYLSRFAAHFLPASENGGGFNRLLSNGALMTEARYSHSGTYTAPGHSVFLSGLTPGQSGVISNEWFDRTGNGGKGTEQYCVSDTMVNAVGIASQSRAGKMSPKNFNGTTLGDFLRERDPESRSIGIAIKDRGAILPAGVKAKGAFWFDSEAGNWISSTAYFPDGNLPAWAQTFNARKLPESYLGKTWTKLLPENVYAMKDTAAGEAPLIGEEQPVFPHTVKDLSKLTDPRFRRSKRFDAVAPTPFGNELTLAIAEAALIGEQLGQRGHTDLLTVSFSSPDYCGHLFGPDSQEQMDILIRLDRQLDLFFKFLDTKVGFENCLIVLSADHGVAPLPEQTKGSERLFKKDFVDALNAAVAPKYPQVIREFYNDEVYLDTAVMRAKGFNAAEVEKFIGEEARKLRGIAGYITRTDILNGNLDATGKMVSNSFNVYRSGDVHIVVKPNTFFAFGQTGTT
ncbi:MAG: alkaline phosphatase family protein, partial [Rhizobacter sp.]|nr:alkaline phosphatase family protein [Chlorobiales bacterium]